MCILTHDKKYKNHPVHTLPVESLFVLISYILRRVTHHFGRARVMKNILHTP